jgi:hypothetical protein
MMRRQLEATGPWDIEASRVAAWRLKRWVIEESRGGAVLMCTLKKDTYME